MTYEVIHKDYGNVMGTFNKRARAEKFLKYQTKEYKKRGFQVPNWIIREAGNINSRTMKGVKYSGKITSSSAEEAKRIYRKNFGVSIVDFKTFKRATSIRKGVYGVWYKD